MAVEEDCAVSKADGEVGEGGGEGYGCYLVWASVAAVDWMRERERAYRVRTVAQLDFC